MRRMGCSSGILEEPCFVVGLPNFFSPSPPLRGSNPKATCYLLSCILRLSVLNGTIKASQRCGPWETSRPQGWFSQATESESSRSRSRNRPYGLVKIENRSRKRSHKLNGIGFGRIRTFPFHPIAFTTPSLMIQCKLGCQSRKQKWKNQPIVTTGVEHCHWFILPLLLATPTMQFSLDRKLRRHKQNWSVFCFRLRQFDFH